jgi:hypothetical protein
MYGLFNCNHANNPYKVTIPIAKPANANNIYGNNG